MISGGEKNIALQESNAITQYRIPESEAHASVAAYAIQADGLCGVFYGNQDADTKMAEHYGIINKPDADQFAICEDLYLDGVIRDREGIENFDRKDQIGYAINSVLNGIAQFQSAKQTLNTPAGWFRDEASTFPPPPPPPEPKNKASGKLNFSYSPTFGNGFGFISSPELTVTHQISKTESFSFTNSFLLWKLQPFTTLADPSNPGGSLSRKGLVPTNGDPDSTWLTSEHYLDYKWTTPQERGTEMYLIDDKELKDFSEFHLTVGPKDTDYDHSTFTLPGFSLELNPLYDAHNNFTLSSALAVGGAKSGFTDPSNFAFFEDGWRFYAQLGAAYRHAFSTNGFFNELSFGGSGSINTSGTGAPDGTPAFYALNDSVGMKLGSQVVEIKFENKNRFDDPRGVAGDSGSRHFLIPSIKIHLADWIYLSDTYERHIGDRGGANQKTFTTCNPWDFCAESNGKGANAGLTSMLGQTGIYNDAGFGIKNLFGIKKLEVYGGVTYAERQGTDNGHVTESHGTWGGNAKLSYEF